ncbi:hypothetical protein AWB67_02341 [Caballeronia terrestris]|jgi:hypothetical protein|uniref:Uncharacterized protein n=1 Tax=Caballeronia terrestris TaxID=1226301 RepID=A0A158I5F4_9BURK|nr:hypothetical protein [Caballeronia terrestris]SAL51593.1 hypothetical protein AWB67_02341 [Caballeronia terrestris]
MSLIVVIDAAVDFFETKRALRIRQQRFGLSGGGAVYRAEEKAGIAK